MNKKTLEILHDTKRAYCDCTLEWNKAVKLRNLDFRASHPVSIKDAVEIMRQSLGLSSITEKGYNNFSPNLLKKLPEKTKVTLAREGSVCVYIKIPKNKCFTEEFAYNKMKVDEYHIVKNEIRLWWD